MESFDEIVRQLYRGTETREVVANLDADWFAQHPHERYRVREYVSGEFDSDSGGVFADLTLAEGYFVLVVRGGMRVLMRAGTVDDSRWGEGGLGLS